MLSERSHLVMEVGTRESDGSSWARRSNQEKAYSNKGQSQDQLQKTVHWTPQVHSGKLVPVLKTYIYKIINNSNDKQKMANKNSKYFKKKRPNSYICVHLCMWVCVYVGAKAHVQRTVQLVLLSTVRVLRMELRSSGFAASTFPPEASHSPEMLNV